MFQKYFSKYSLAALIVFTCLGLFLFYQNKVASSNKNNSDWSNFDKPEILEPADRQVSLSIETGQTFGQLMSQAGISSVLAQEIYQLALDDYDLAKIRAGYQLTLIFHQQSDTLKSLHYPLNTEEEILVSREVLVDETGQLTTNDWQVKYQAIPYETKLVIKEATVKSSVYQAALDNNIDERAIISLANAFQWSLDFAMDTRQGDSFKFIYEERYLNGEYKMPGKILAGQYLNDGSNYQLFYFEDGEDNQGYFDIDGNSVQKMFLKAPLEFKYISSGFTTGQRYIEAFNISTGHRAIDYAAAMGTPVRTVGDGKVTIASRQGSYGNKVSIRHNGTYTTNYAHLSRFAVKVGNQVKQGQIIGYVGSTGLSTGPHLHYEMVKNGVKVNPLREILPPGEPIKEENRQRFNEEITYWQELLAQ